jgi:hypothetical protein
MPALSSWSRYFSGGIVVLIAVFSVSTCGLSRRMIVFSLSHKSSIEIYQSQFPVSVQVDLVTTGRRTVLIQQKSDATISFIHVFWSRDESKVAVLSTGYATFAIAAEVGSGAQIPFDLIKKDFALSLRETYKLPAVYPDEPNLEFDVFKWAQTEYADQAFAKLHPDVKFNRW